VKKLLTIVLIIVAQLGAFYTVRLYSFVEGFNQCTDQTYDYVHGRLVEEGMTGNEILHSVASGKAIILYYYVKPRDIALFDLEQFKRAIRNSKRV